MGNTSSDKFWLKLLAKYLKKHEEKVKVFKELPDYVSYWDEDKEKTIYIAKNQLLKI